MLHEVMIPFTFDTTPVESLVAETGEAEVKRAVEEIVEKGVKASLPKRYSYGRVNYDVDWNQLVKECINEWLNEHAQEIVDEAVILLAARGRSKKQWREMLAEIREEES